jgi:hypothetical protein
LLFSGAGITLIARRNATVFDGLRLLESDMTSLPVRRKARHSASSTKMRAF